MDERLIVSLTKLVDALTQLVSVAVKQINAEKYR